MWPLERGADRFSVYFNQYHEPYEKASQSPRAKKAQRVFNSLSGRNETKSKSQIMQKHVLYKGVWLYIWCQCLRVYIQTHFDKLCVLNSSLALT